MKAEWRKTGLWQLRRAWLTLNLCAAKKYKGQSKEEGRMRFISYSIVKPYTRHQLHIIATHTNITDCHQAELASVFWWQNSFQSWMTHQIHTCHSQQQPWMGEIPDHRIWNLQHRFVEIQPEVGFFHVYGAESELFDYQAQDVDFKRFMLWGFNLEIRLLFTAADFLYWTTCGPC